MATLGDVPGLYDMLPNGEIVPLDPSLTEVDSLGQEVGTALGDITMALGEGVDPFAFRPTVNDGSTSPNSEQDVGTPRPARDPMASSYLPTYDDSGNVSTGGGVGDWDDEQVSNAETIARVGKEVGASARDIQTALMAAIVESGLKNLDYGDRDSVGLFQQRDAWGSFEQRTTPVESAKMFFLGGNAGQRGLLDIEDRKGMSLGEAAQAVQVSAFPDRYAEHESEAAELMGAVTGGSRTTGSYRGKDPYDLTDFDGKTVDYMTAAALDAATKEFGGEFGVMQGSHSTGVAASGNTHAGGGVVDLDVPNGDWEGAVKALRKIGFAAWARNIPGHGSAGSGAHIHAVLIGNKALSPQAAVQVNSYLHDDDGLSGSRADDGPRDFVNNRFVWGQTQKSDHLDKARESIIKQANTFLGTPFKWGGEDYDGVDGMGFLRGTYKHLGVTLPKMTADLIAKTTAIPIDQTKPGDLIAWGDDKFGVYLGKGQFIEAGGPGRVVQLNELGSDALSVWGIPMDQVLRRARPTAPDPFDAPAPHNVAAPQTIQTTEIRPGTSVVEPRATKPAADPIKPKAAGAFAGGTTFDQKPKGLA